MYKRQLYDASKSQWTNPFIKTIDISGATGDTEFYLSTDGSFKESKYLSVEAPDKQSKATYKTVYVSNDDWKSLTKVYATFDYNDAYEAVSYTHLRAHETKANLVCRLLLEKKKNTTPNGHYR